MKIGNFDTDKKVLIVAEIGNNHEGDFEVAKNMISAAAEAGADAVKFQTIIPNRLVSTTQKERIKQLSKFSFTRDEFIKLKSKADKENVMFLSTPFDLEVVDWLAPLIPAFKVASGDNDFWPLLEKIAFTGKPMIISLGLDRVAEAKELKDFIETIWKNHHIAQPGLAFLHCMVSYPTPYNEANLWDIQKIRFENITPGYSDHTIGIKAAELAVACGARIIEKHFTLDKSFSSFRDHQLSADPKELAELVQAINKTESFLGRNKTFGKSCEHDNKEAIGRSIAANRNISPGEKVTFTDLCWLRPRRGLIPGDEKKLVGKILKSPIKEGDFFSLDHLI
jgi:N,N'-diacetyllegionaminate synthase